MLRQDDLLGYGRGLFARQDEPAYRPKIDDFDIQHQERL